MVVQARHQLQTLATRLDELLTATVADFLEDEENVVRSAIEDFRPDDPGGARLGQLDRHGKALALAPHRPADDVVDVQHPAGLLRPDAPLVQGEDGPLRDDEQAPQLGEPGDHIVGQGVGRPTAPTRRGGGVIDERHHRQGSPARRHGGDALTAAADDMVDRFGALPTEVEHLMAVARLRNQARAVGVADILTQGARIKLHPVELPDSKQVRLKRLYPGANYRAAAKTLQVPMPRESKAINSPNLRDMELLQWVADFMSEMLDAPKVSVAGSTVAEEKPKKKVFSVSE